MSPRKFRAGRRWPRPPGSTRKGKVDEAFPPPRISRGELRRGLIIRCDDAHAPLVKAPRLRQNSIHEFAARRLTSRSIMYQRVAMISAAAAIAAMTAPAQANIVIAIDKGSQQMSVSVD